MGRTKKEEVENVVEAEGTETFEKEEAAESVEEAGRSEEADEAKNAEVDEDAAEETEDSAKDEYVDYCLPFLPGKEMGDSQTVTINGKNYQVAYGVPVKVPLGVKEILEDMVISAGLLKAKIDRLTKEERCIAKFDD